MCVCVCVGGGGPIGARLRAQGARHWKKLDGRASEFPVAYAAARDAQEKGSGVPAPGPAPPAAAAPIAPIALFTPAGARDAHALFVSGAAAAAAAVVRMGMLGAVGGAGGLGGVAGLSGSAAASAARPRAVRVGPAAHPSSTDPVRARSGTRGWPWGSHAGGCAGAAGPSAGRSADDLSAASTVCCAARDP